MANAHYFYLPFSVPDSTKAVEAHQESFEEYLNDLFSEDELLGFEVQLDSISAIFVQPIMNELSFDDFYLDVARIDEQRSFFDSCRSCICLENMPDLHSNPFQVTYLIQLLGRFGEALIDLSGVETLRFKADYLEELRKLRSVDSIVSSPLERPVDPRPSKPVFPIDFIVLDVYRELDRLRAQHKIYFAVEQVESLPEKAQRIFRVMKEEKLDSSSLLGKSGLIPKDFGDNLERLKFFLKKL